MSRDTTIKTTVDIGANIGDFESALKKIQGELGKLSLTPSVSKDFQNIFSTIEKEIKNIQNLTANDRLKLIDDKKVGQSFEKIENYYKSLVTQLKSKGINSSFLEADAKVIDKFQKAIEDYTA